MNSLARMEAIGRSGLAVSVCCGPAEGRFTWTVQVLTEDGDEFDEPFEARDFDHAIEIAESEIAARGWSPQ